MQTRRTFLATSSATLTAAALSLSHGEAASAAADTSNPAGWRSLLGTSISESAPVSLNVEGKIPAALRGTLYRNGPGLFERGGYRKSNALDGDGLVQRLTLADGQATHQSRFVRTEKFLEEEAADAYRYETWTTRAPGSFLNNLGADFKTQAGVTVYEVNGRLFALDEVSPIYEIEASDLTTLGPTSSGLAATAATKAHTKVDSKTGDWIVMGSEFGPTMKMHAAIHHMDGSVTTLPPVDAPRQVYTHDFFATENYLIVNLQPAEIGLVSFLGGITSFTDSFTWKPEQGNIIAVIPKDGSAARFFDAPGAWMWHAANAYERGNTIIADFAGYDDPGHFIGDDPTLTALMSGRLGQEGGPGTMRRYIIDLDAGTLREEIVAASAFEFPSVDPRTACHAHQRVYATYGPRNNFLHTGLAAVDMESGDVASYDFGPSAYVGEPIFALHPDSATDGWLLTQVLDGDAGTTFFAIFDSQNLAGGPLAKAHLNHHQPISFHGHWAPA
eukprot:s1_g120.t1